MIFIDAGAFIAYAIAPDEHHEAVSAAWDRLIEERLRPFTSNLVLSEAFSLIARRGGYEVALRRAREVYSSRTLVILRPDLDDEMRALAFFEKYADQEISFTDAVSFALMRRHHIEHAFTFDRHFELAGFRLWP